MKKRCFTCGKTVTERTAFPDSFLFYCSKKCFEKTFLDAIAPKKNKKKDKKKEKKR